MTEPARHLHAIDAAGEVIEGDPEVVALKQKLLDLEDENEGLKSALSAAKGVNTRLKRQLAGLRFADPAADDVRAVLTYHQKVLMPGASISEQSARWGVVADLLKLKKDQSEEPLFTPLKLQAAVAGMALQPYIMDPDHTYRRDLTTAFCSRRNGGPALPDPGKVDRHIAEARGFRRRYGTSALEIVDELSGRGLAWLAARCSGCGRTWLEHLKLPGLCPGFEDFDWRVQVGMLELEGQREVGDA